MLQVLGFIFLLAFGALVCGILAAEVMALSNPECNRVRLRTQRIRSFLALGALIAIMGGVVAFLWFI